MVAVCGCVFTGCAVVVVIDEEEEEEEAVVVFHMVMLILCWYGHPVVVVQVAIYHGTALSSHPVVLVQVAIPWYCFK